MFDEAFCKETVDQLKKSLWNEHSYTLPSNYESVSYDDEFSISYEDIKNKDAIMKGIWNAYKQYLEELNFRWFNSWSGYSGVRFNKYDEDTRMNNHCDHIHSLFEGTRRGIPTMTALGTLNDDYEGGDLVFWEDKKIVIPPGHIAVFPSNYLFPHYVSKITKGTRFSYVSWAW